MNTNSSSAEVLFLAAAALATPELQAEFLDRECAGDTALRARADEPVTATPSERLMTSKCIAFLHPPLPPFRLVKQGAAETSNGVSKTALIEQAACSEGHSRKGIV